MRPPRTRLQALPIVVGLLGACAGAPITEYEPEASAETEHEDSATTGLAAQDSDRDKQEHEGCSDAELQRIGDILALQTDAFAGAQVFTGACGEAYCHGPDGVAGPAPELPEEIPEHSDVELGCVLLTGPGEMPSLAPLTDQELADVIAYVRQTF